MKLRKASFVASLLALVSLASSASAQPARPDVDEFGTQDGIDLWIPAASFVPAGGSWGIIEAGYGTANVDSGFWANVPLPQGAYVDSWRALFCDESATHHLLIEFLKEFGQNSGVPVGSNFEQILSSFTSGATPGCTAHHELVGTTIDLREPADASIPRSEAADFYTFHLFMPGDQSVAFKGIRVFWHRQVSPAPATATFNDVPTTDPAFQFIEALAASGITSGCNTSPPMYCPDATLTRRQMAVFLSKALGLHWPPF